MIRQLFRFFIVLFLISSCEEIVNVVNISNDTIQLLAPTNNAVLPTKEKIVFSWQSLADVDSYHLQIARPSFDTAIQIELDSTISTTNFSIDSLKANSYEWRVKGLNSAFETVYTVNVFTVEEL